jgi:hypothetical protein
MSTISLSEPQQTKYAEYTVRPGISFYQALRCRFQLDQVTYTVGDCPDDIFKRFITLCSQPTATNKHWKPLHQHKLLFMLDQDCSDVARWYAIETLLAHQVMVPLENDEERQSTRASVA